MMRAGLFDQEPAGGAKQTQASPTKTQEQATPSTPTDSAVQEESDLAQVQAELKAVHEPDVHALAKALGIDLPATGADPADSPTSSLQDLGDLDGDGVSEFALKLMPSVKGGAPEGGGADELPSWQLILLAWDGAEWRASRIKAGFEPYEVQALSSLIPGSRQIALVVYSGAQAIPYPAIYQIKDHTAAQVWDGRSDESLYEGLVQGRIEFRNSNEGATPVMIASGRADPGLLHFPIGSPRGFDVQTIYAWDGHGYTPKRTEYRANEDYKIYLFISALHLHDFRSAYALIDPPRFLKTGAPSLELFRKQIQASWPEFLDDKIFEIPEAIPTTPGKFAFELNDEDKHYIYTPSFAAGSKLLITGLERHERPGGGR
ncbi:MAG TPA: hypothetical protein VG028_09455 [Terriglobia bacterium]|nr:hypothetical protein [Terriglobia bacterium]